MSGVVPLPLLLPLSVVAAASAPQLVAWTQRSEQVPSAASLQRWDRRPRCLQQEQHVAAYSCSLSRAVMTKKAAPAKQIAQEAATIRLRFPPLLMT
jgi:hypothetical protein